MDDIRQFSSIIGNLYDCVSDPSRWQKTLQVLCDRFDGVMATLGVLDPGKSQTRFSVWCGDPDLVMPLITKYAADMPFYGVLHKAEIDVPIGMETLFEFYGPDGREVLLNSRMYQEWSVPNGIEDCFGLTVMKLENRVGSLNIATHKSRAPIRREEFEVLAFLAPHIRRAVTIGDLFGTEQRDAHVFQNVIDSLNFSVLIVGTDMKLHYANPMAESLLRDGTAVKSSTNIVSFESPLAQMAIVHAVITGERDEVALGTTGIGVPLARVQRPAVAHVLPLGRRHDSANFHHNSAAAIFVAAAGATLVPAIEAIAALFGLTAAEKKVASQVAGGLTRAEIAAASGVADGTVKSQLTTIYDKTGASSQRELELLIRELTPPVKPADQ